MACHELYRRRPAGAQIPLSPRGYRKGSSVGGCGADTEDRVFPFPYRGRPLVLRYAAFDGVSPRGERNLQVTRGPPGPAARGGESWVYAGADAAGDQPVLGRRTQPLRSP